MLAASQASTRSTSAGPGPRSAAPAPDGARRETECPAARSAATAVRRSSTSPRAPARTRRTFRGYGTSTRPVERFPSRSDARTTTT